MNLEGLQNNRGAEVALGNFDFSFWEQVHFPIGSVLYDRHIVGNREITFVIQKLPIIIKV